MQLEPRKMYSTGHPSTQKKCFYSIVYRSRFSITKRNIFMQGNSSNLQNKNRTKFRKLSCGQKPEGMNVNNAEVRGIRFLGRTFRVYSTSSCQIIIFYAKAAVHRLVGAYCQTEYPSGMCILPSRKFIEL
jgi:hypothetical protein